jgi:hypothetical protein
MRVLARITIPVEAGNRALKDGSLPQLLQQTGERWKPEAMYFAPHAGKRAAYIVMDLPKESDLVNFSEPFFSQLDAEIEVCR